jgi:hypothetical protein
MSIIFKESYFSEYERDYIKKYESLELSIALMERLNFNDSHAIFQISSIDEPTFYAVREKNGDDFRNSFTTIEGTESLNHNEIKNITHITNMDNLEINFKILDKYRNLLSDFNVLSFSKSIEDKNGDKYTLKYHSNYNICPIGSGKDDILRVYNSNNKEIGYLKAIYTPTEDYLILNPTVIHKVLEIHNNDYDIHINSSKEELLARLGRTQSGDKKIDLENIDNEFQTTIEMLTKKYNDELKNRNTNLATIMYSNLNDEWEDEEKTSYKGKGLAQLMYFEVAKELNKKGIEFRSSSQQTPDAKKLWKNLQNNLKGNVEIIKFNDFDVYKLSVNEDENLKFVNGKLKHTSIDKFILNSIPKKHIQSSINKNI